jgi:cholesterol oxidase
LQLSPALGTRFSANGDLLGLGYNTRVQSNIVGTGDGPPLSGMARTGPTITAAADYRSNSVIANRYLIEEAAIPSALADALRLAMPLAAGVMPEFAATQRMGRDATQLRADGALNHSTVFLGIGHDSASGRVQLDATGTARVVWPGLPDEPFVSRMRAEMAQLSALFSGKYVDSPRTSPIFGGALTTVHPLGGCPMGDRGEDAVVNADGQVYNPFAGPLAVHDGLWVSDGAVIPGSLGANPMLTIAALAERAAERFPL